MTADALADALRPIVRRLVAEALEESPASTPAPDRLYDLAEAGELLGVSRTVVYELIGRGDLRSTKVGRRRLVAASDIARFIESVKSA